MFCKNCQSTVPDNELFCRYCGARLVSEKEIEEFQKRIYGNSAVVTNEVSNPTSESKRKGNKNISSKTVAIIIAVVIAVIAVGVGLCLLYSNIFNRFTKNTKQDAPFIYEANGELLAYKNIKEKSEPFLISYNSKCFLSEQLDSHSYLLSEDGKYVVYIEYIQAEQYKITKDLYIKKLFDKKDNGTLLAKNIESLIEVTGNVDNIYYQKNGDIYAVNSKGESNKITSGGDSEYCLEHHTSADNKKMLVVYGSNASDDTKEIKLIDLKAEKAETLSDNVSSFKYDENLSKICFAEDNCLYVIGFGSEKQKLLNATYKISEYDYYLKDGNVYYLEETDKLSLKDFVEDDCGVSDLKMERPDWDDYNHTTAFKEVDFETEMREREKFEHDEDEYDAAQERIELREKLGISVDYDSEYDDYDDDYDDYDSEYDDYDDDYDDYDSEYDDYDSNYDDDDYSKEREYALYCYDGEKTQIADQVRSLNCIYSVDDDSVNCLYVNIYEKHLKDLPKINIKKIEFSSDISDYVIESVHSLNVISGKKTNLLFEYDQKENKDICYFDKSKNAYIVSIENNNSTYKLYSIPENSGFDKAELICDECEECYFINGKLGYFTENGSLYYDGTEIKDFNGDSIKTVNGDNLCFYYSTDYNKNTNESTVWKYSKGKTEKIADDVYFTKSGFDVFDGKYVYITEHIKGETTGDLVCKDGDDLYTLCGNASYICNSNTNGVKDIIS